MRLLLALMWLLHWLPLPLLGRLGDGVGSLLYLVMRPRRHITLTNLRLCMPELSERERDALARRHFQALRAQRAGARRAVVGFDRAAAAADPGGARARRAGAKDVQDVQREPACRWRRSAPARPFCCARISSAWTWPAWR